MSDAPLTRAQLVAKVLVGDTLTIMGVPPGTGPRLAIDRDLNGVLDGDEPLPRLQISQVGANAVITWPLGAAGFHLETSATLASDSWTNFSGPVEIIGGLNVITNTGSASATFFRLRQP